MFAVVVSGHLVQSNFEQVNPNNYVCTLPSVDNSNHIVVFLSGSQPFPDGFGGSVYFSLPNLTGASEWHLLGTITNQKPSSIFKISGLKATSASSGPGTFGVQSNLQAQIGISVQPMFEIEALTPAKGVEPSSTSAYTEFSERMCKNLYNYVSSFAQPPNQIVPSPSEEYLPLSSVSKWYDTFLRRLSENPNFWKT